MRLDRRSPPFAKGAKDEAPSKFKCWVALEGEEIAVECGDYGYYTDGDADKVWDQRVAGIDCG